MHDLPKRAYGILIARAVMPVVIFVDIKMAGLDGVEATRLRHPGGRQDFGHVFDAGRIRRALPRF
jgi:hypothetical protein